MPIQQYEFDMHVSGKLRVHVPVWQHYEKHSVVCCN